MHSPCVQTRVAGRCDRCHVRVERLHMPDKAHGFFCSAHCPTCSQPVTPNWQRRTDRKLERLSARPAFGGSR